MSNKFKICITSFMSDTKNFQIQVIYQMDELKKLEKLSKRNQIIVYGIEETQNGLKVIMIYTGSVYSNSAHSFVTANCEQIF